MASSLLPPPTFANKHRSLLATAKHPAPRLTRCGAGGGAVPDELLGALHLGRQSDTVVATVGVSEDTSADGWIDLLDEIKGALQADAPDPAATASDAPVVPDVLLSSPPASVDAANAAAGMAVAVPDEALTSAADTSRFIPEELLGALHMDASSPPVRAATGALARLDALAASLTEPERWAAAGLLAVVWLYLTARPGVLSGAVDAYLLAPLQLALDSALGRRSLKMSDFVVGERIGEGSFGVVYSGAVVPKGGAAVEERRGKAKTKLQLDDRYKEKVILKKVISSIKVWDLTLIGREIGNLIMPVLSDKSGDGWSQGVRRLRGVVQLPCGQGGAGVLRGFHGELRRRQDQVGVREGRQMARLEI